MRILGFILALVLAGSIAAAAPAHVAAAAPRASGTALST